MLVVHLEVEIIYFLPQNNFISSGLIPSIHCFLKNRDSMFEFSNINTYPDKQQK
jgi:hypothetical protein